MVFIKLLIVVVESGKVLSTAPNLKQRSIVQISCSPGLWTQILGTEWRKGAWLLCYMCTANSVNIVLASLLNAKSNGYE